MSAGLTPVRCDERGHPCEAAVCDSRHTARRRLALGGVPLAERWYVRLLRLRDIASARQGRGRGAVVSKTDVLPGSPSRRTSKAALTPAEPPSERQIITVLAADIVGSTRHIAACDPDEAQAFFDTLFDYVRGTVERADGVLVSYAGDGGIAAFGWPTPFEDHADRACAAAWDLAQVGNERLGPD